MSRGPTEEPNRDPPRIVEGDSPGAKWIEALRQEPLPSWDHLPPAPRPRPPLPHTVPLGGVLVGAALLGAVLWGTRSPSRPAPPPSSAAEPAQPTPQEPPVHGTTEPKPPPPTAEPAPVVAAPTHAPDTVATDARATAAPRPRTKRRRPGAPRKQRSEHPSEVDLLEAAARALRAHPGEALRLLDRAARRYPRGTLRQEREVLRIEALIRLGRQRKASRTARRFLTRWPTSALRPRVERLLREAGEAPSTK